ncbi:MAG: ATP-binding protein, partial [Omnitrophica bacterium]|nr:ATP-binding protein [Candidatus Omnitrophota bacterium]
AALIYNLPEAPEELPQGGIVVVKISDTGCGISAQHISRIFDPFFTTKGPRSGLGLAFARKIIEKHRGIIKVQSKPGEGSTFWVCLPISPQLS